MTVSALISLLHKETALSLTEKIINQKSESCQQQRWLCDVINEHLALL